MVIFEWLYETFASHGELRRCGELFPLLLNYKSYHNENSKNKVSFVYFNLI